MKIAVFFTASPESGGAFQYQLNLLNILKQTKKHKILVLTGNDAVANNFKKDFEIINLSRIVDKIRSLKHQSIEGESITNIDPKELSKEKLKSKWENKKNKSKVSLFDKVTCKAIELYLKIKGVDLILWPAPLNTAFKINIPYIFTVYDLEHRRRPDFPELSAFGEYERREFLYENGLKKATAIIADSEQGKKDIIKHYGTDKRKIFPIKFLAPTYLNDKIPQKIIKDTIKKYNIPEKYFFYPAQFWPHKNHILILKALSLLRKEGIEIHAVFSGSDKRKWGTLEELKKSAKELGISDLIHYVGYVSNEEMSVLYKMSKGLVMPDELGPSNIPYLEAFKLGVPVIAMNVPGIKDQVQDAAIMGDPKDERKLAKYMKTLLTNKRKVKQLVANGKKVLISWPKSEFKKELLKVIDYSEQKIKY